MSAGIRHEALIYRGSADWLASVHSFVQEGLTHGEPVSAGLSAPAGALLRKALLDLWPRVEFFDMTALGRNPGRIIPAMLEFADRHPGSPLRYVSEPLWPGRSAAELAETIRHEALIEPALAGIAARVLCIYDADGLDASAVSYARLTHPAIITGRVVRPSPRYPGPGIVPPHCDRPLLAPLASVTSLSYKDELRPVRTHAAARARAAGLTPDRTADLVLAVSEVAANTLSHTSGSGLLRTWVTRDEIICEISDSGHVTDPLAGRQRPPGRTGGQGLWVVNQVCDLVELRSGQDGTTVRMHMYR